MTPHANDPPEHHERVDALIEHCPDNLDRLVVIAPEDGIVELKRTELLGTQNQDVNISSFDLTRTADISSQFLDFAVQLVEVGADAIDEISCDFRCEFVSVEQPSCDVGRFERVYLDNRKKLRPRIRRLP